jgi:hypothetical protein
MTAAAALAIASASVLNADVIYSNLATDPYTGNSWGISGTADNMTYNAYASWFVAPSNAIATEIDVPLYADTGTRSMNIALYANDSNTNLPGTNLSGLQSVSIPDGNPSILYTVTFAGVPLTAGQTYWVGVLPGADDTSGGWKQNPDLSQQVAYSPDGSSWQNSGEASPGEFRVMSVPEPASLGAAAIGVLLAVRRRRR